MLNESNHFFGIVIDYATEPNPPYRDGFSLELVAFDDLSPFLQHDNQEPTLKNSNNENLRAALKAYRDNGVNSKEFGQEKLNFLGNLAIYKLDIFLDNTSGIRDIINLFDWYVFELHDAEDEYDAILHTEYDNPDSDYNKTFGIATLNDEEQTKLKDIFSLASMNTKQGDAFGEGDANHNVFNALAPGTVITAVEVLNIGQGLCAALSSGGAPYQLEGFFDLGFGNVNHVQPAMVAAIVGAIQAHPVAQGIDIILSHWHDDHWRIGNHLGAAGLANTHWHAPDYPASPTAIAFALNIQQNGGALHLYGPNVLGATVVPAGGLQAAANMTMYKMNGPGAHPHHHSNYAVLTLAGGNMFLSGDCTYPLIPAAIRGIVGGYRYLQVSHHGGDYCVGLANNPADIPTPEPVAQGANPTSAAIYSYGQGNQHGHPAAWAVADHVNAGYINALALQTVNGNIICI